MKGSFIIDSHKPITNILHEFLSLNNFYVFIKNESFILNNILNYFMLNFINKYIVIKFILN
ncbi:MAG: hypothetical protein CMC21_02285 [Flavobacteriaceae bacterium]|nr:hypothetical protein [Flavobacteriaceae bacterium]